ncbi:DUF4244 domain-containing protein [Nonomuraea sp. NPDC050783]|uniref:DUF4244 domain-containing protein n=1 Tax=Nonomuraea sp. NPDC050783 TaxID=3154634 RepID=UPI0034664F9D
MPSPTIATTRQDTGDAAPEITALAANPGPADAAKSADTGSRTVRPASRRRFNKWLHYASVHRERGMSTAEYAVGTIAACAFAALLFKIVNSSEISELLSAIIGRALNTNTNA